MIGSQVELGQLVKLCREHRGVTQGQLAQQLELSRTAVAHLEQGLRLPEPSSLRRLCEHLGLPEVLWEGFIPRDSLYPMAVRCHCRTYLSPDPTSANDQRRAAMVHAIRTGEPWQDGKRTFDDPYETGARRLRKTFGSLFLNRTFVPVPPPHQKGEDEPEEPWVSQRLAEAYAAEGTACRVVSLFRRARALRHEGDDGRPTVAEHLATLRLTEEHVPPGLVLVDDVLHRGSTLMACATRLTHLGWRGQVDALAVAYVLPAEGGEAADGRTLMLGWDGKWPYPVQSG